MNKQLLIISIAAILAAPSAFAVDTASDTQVVHVTVPEVNLINIDDATVPMPALELTKVGLAGSGFKTGTPVTSSYAFSGNTDTAGAIKNQITVAASAIPVGGTLKIESAPLGGGIAGPTSTAIAGLTSSALSAPLLTGIGNVAAPAVGLTYTFGPTETNGMVGYTSATGDDVTLTYTISNG
jgi:hypothetical protein